MRPRNPLIEADNYPPLYAVSEVAGTAAIRGVGNPSAGLFSGNVEVLGEAKTESLVTGSLQVTGEIIGSLSLTGDIFLLGGADLAEEFECDGPPPEPGTVMVFSDDGCIGKVFARYDTRVVGIVAGAGRHRPGIVSGSRDPTRYGSMAGKASARPKQRRRQSPSATC